VYAGQELAEALQSYRDQGLSLVYSSHLVTASMKVLNPPRGNDAVSQLREILNAHQLDLKTVDGLFLVVRETPDSGAGSSPAMILLLIESPGMDGTISIDSEPALGAAQKIAGGLWQFESVAPGSYQLTVTAPGYHSSVHQVEVKGSEIRLIKPELAIAPAQLEELNVSASRYVLIANSQFYIDQRAIQALPDLGEDPIRSAHRLPGAAAGGLSARSHFRGGENDETAIYFNGLKLTDPFHIRDYHNIFSSIDARAVAGVEAYTGGFPARYGDQMSGVLLLESQRPDQPRHTELGFSIYNTSLLSSGYSEDGKWEWLGSARRSNLGLLLSDDLGKPDYFDVFAELAVYLNPDTRLSLNALYADDQVLVITESDPSELEQSKSNTRNTHAWFRLENQWTANLSSGSSIWLSSLDNSRIAEVNDPEQMQAAVNDQRRIKSYGLSQQWNFDGFTNHQLRWGFEWARDDARYDYHSHSEYFEFAANWPGLENPTETDIQANPSGQRYGIYVADRWQFSESSAVDLGLRWDSQHYTSPEFNDQLSPRISFLHSFNTDVELRLTWGRYYQSQAIQRLQVEDGIDHFFAPQRADHFIAGIRYQPASKYRLRVEVFQKNYDRLKPRFENLYDSLALIPELEPDRVRLDPTSAQAHGLELSLESRNDSDLDWWVSYSLSRTTDQVNGQKQNRSWDQRHAIQAGMALQKGPWEYGLALSWHSGWPTTGMELGFDEEEDEYFPLAGPRNAENLANYLTLDFRVSREFNVRKGRLSAFFEVSNATNRKNPCCIDFDTDEDEDGNVFLDRTVDNWLPLLPAIGLFWEF
jgi:outer membrane receptor protein involved in Fe transport